MLVSDMLANWPVIMPGDIMKTGFGFSLAIAVFISALACGSSEGQSHLDIVGGSRVTATDPIIFSTVALVQPSGWQFCTGSLIDANHVITASHCLADFTDSTLYIAFGGIARSGYYTRARLRTASHYVVHENFDTAALDQDVASRPPNDIALITLSQSAPSGFLPVSMLKAADNLVVGEPLILAGFGLTKATAGSSGLLRRVDSKLHSIDQVAKEIEFGDSPGKGACMGDSGGPAFVKRGAKIVLVGITSRGSGNCDAGGIYTDVRQFQAWIGGKVAAAP